MVFASFWSENGYRLCPCWSGIGYSFRGSYGGIWTFLSTGSKWIRNKNALTAALSVACLEIRSRNEEAIYSTRNRIYFLQVFTSYFIDVDTFFLFLNWFSTRVSDYRKYVCGCRLYACINTRKYKGLDSREFTSLPEVKIGIYMARHFNHRRKYTACSIQWK